MKKIVALLLSITTIASTTGCSRTSTAKATAESTQQASAQTTEAVAESSDPAELSGTLTVWSSGEELGRFVEGFNAIYPNITVDITVVPNADFLAKLTPALSSGQDAPDIFTGESDYVKYLVDSGYWDDLSGAPYNADTSDTWDYILYCKCGL